MKIWSECHAVALHAMSKFLHIIKNDGGCLERVLPWCCEIGHIKMSFSDLINMISIINKP